MKEITPSHVRSAIARTKLAATSRATSSRLSLSRSIHSSPVSTIELPKQAHGAGASSAGVSLSTDASFEVLGSPFSLLSVKLAPSQTLYTRRGTLLGLTGNPENTLSTLSILSPLQRAVAAVPFLYQKITSTSPLTAIIGTNTTSSTITTITLDGRTDWMVGQRAGLLAWTGTNLIIRAKLNLKMVRQMKSLGVLTADLKQSIAQWGNTLLTGRGLVSLVGRGQVYQINLAANEDYVLHPKHVLAYSINGTSPAPYRFRSNALRLQIPSISTIIPDTRFFREMSKTSTWRALSQFFYMIRTWTRRSIFGDALFLRFQGPATILVQSRASSIRETLSSQEINEIADSPAGALRSLDTSSPSSRVLESVLPVAANAPSQSLPLKHATISADGKVTIS